LATLNSTDVLEMHIIPTFSLAILCSQLACLFIANGNFVAGELKPLYFPALLSAYPYSLSNIFYMEFVSK
jgi:hypothetical protein